MIVNKFYPAKALGRNQKKHLVETLVKEEHEKKGEPLDVVPTYLKVLNFLDLPFDYLRKVTILPAEKEDFHHYWTYLWCVFGVSFLLMFTVGFTLLSLYIFLPVATFFLLLFFYF